MHELAIAQDILKTVKINIKKQKITQVKKIHISIGVLAGVDKDSLEFNFSLLPKEDLFKKTKLVIKNNVLVIYCQNCDIETQIKNGFVLKCSKCGKLSPKIIKGKELTIDKIEY